MKYLFILAFLITLFTSNVYADQTATLTWSPNKEADLSKYNIYRSKTPIRNYKLVGTTDKNNTSFKDSTIPDDWTIVYYKITAVDFSGNESGYSESVNKSLEVLPVLGKVIDLAASNIDYSSIEISFTDISTKILGILSYDIRILAGDKMTWYLAKSVVLGTCKSPLLGEITINKRVCTITGLLPNTKYQIQLVPFFGTMNLDAQYKDFSNIVSITTFEKPKSFTNVIINDDSIEFTYEPKDCPRGVSKSTSGNTSSVTRNIIMTCVK